MKQPKTTIKLAIFDIDGVLRDSKGVPEKTSELLRSLEKSGVQWTVATGRGFLRTRDLLPGLTPTAPLVTEGGGKIVDAEGNVLAFYPLQNEEIRQLAGPLQDEHLDMACFCRFSDGKYILYSPEGTANESIKKWPIQTIAEVTTKFSEFQNLAIHEKTAKIAILPKKGSEGMILIPFGVTHTINTRAYDFCSKFVGKHLAIETLARLVGIPLEETLFAGDDWNDVDTFAQLPLGAKIAIGDCPASLRNLSTGWVRNLNDLADEVKKYL